MSDSRSIGTAAADLGGIEGGRVRLDLFDASKLDRGQPGWIEAAWFVVQWLFVASFLSGSSTRSALLQLFGPRIGKSVMIKPRMRVKSRRRLEIGDGSRIDEGVWIENLATVRIGIHCCLVAGQAPLHS